MVDSIAGTSGVDAAVAAILPTAAANPAVSGSANAGGGAAAATPARTQPIAITDADVSTEIAQYLRANGHEMKFDIDGTTKQVIVKVYNSATGELVRQIPNEELVHLAQTLRAGGKHTLEASA